MLLSGIRTQPATASIKFNADAQAAREYAEAMRGSPVLPLVPPVSRFWDDLLIWLDSKVWED